MFLLRSMSRLWKACSTKLKKKAKIFTNVLRYTAIPHLQVVCNHLCRFSMAGMLDLTCQYRMLLRNSLGIQPEVVVNNDKHAVLPMHDLYVGQQLMYQDSASKHWYPAVIDSLCPEPRSYKITTRDCIVYRKTLSHLKHFTPQNKNLQSNQCVSSPMAQSNHMQPVKTEYKKKSQVNNTT